MTTPSPGPTDVDPSSHVAEPTARGVEASNEAHKRPRILVVEDDEDIMRCLAMRLELSGFEVLGAGDHRSALELAEGSPPDAAIFDISFPGGDGVMLTKELRERAATEQLPVMILTASMRPGIEEEALASGATGFMRKPYDSRALVSELKRWCSDDAVEQLAP